MTPAPTRRIEPFPVGWRSACWVTGVFDTARRPDTALAQGTIRTPQHILLVTIRGGAERIEVATDTGHRYDGPDRPGAVSFVPAHCERRLRMHHVRSEWASIALPPELLDDVAERRIVLPAFTNVDDGFLWGAVSELWRLLHADGTLEPAYGETMSHALAQYLVRRYGEVSPGAQPAPMKLTPWQLRRVAAFVEAHLGEEIRIADLAAQAGVSAGHFHRAFRTSTGKTPLAYVNEARVARAAAILATESMPVAALALRVGFLSASHFARIFRRATGRSPSLLRQGGRST
jgi:AraC family transcriptional regulator